MDLGSSAGVATGVAARWCARHHGCNTLRHCLRGEGSTERTSCSDISTAGPRGHAWFVWVHLLESHSGVSGFAADEQRVTSSAPHTSSCCSLQGLRTSHAIGKRDTRSRERLMGTKPPSPRDASPHRAAARFGKARQGTMPCSVQSKGHVVSCLVSLCALSHESSTKRNGIVLGCIPQLVPNTLWHPISRDQVASS